MRKVKFVTMSAVGDLGTADQFSNSLVVLALLVGVPVKICSGRDHSVSIAPLLVVIIASLSSRGSPTIIVHKGVAS